MRLGLLGGSFNPIHYGHLRLAEEAVELLGLDAIVFMPTFLSPHKDSAELIDPVKRLEMARMAVAGNPRFSASDVEIKRGGRSYTVDTLKELSGNETDITLVLGVDSFNEIYTWKEHAKLFDLADVAVVKRPGWPTKPLEEALGVELAKAFWYDSNEDTHVNSNGNTIGYLNTTLLDISSSDVRRRVGTGLSIRYLTPDKVIDYINEKGLYGPKQACP